MLAALSESFAGKDKKYPAYRQVRFERNIPYQGGTAAELEYTYVAEPSPARCRIRLFPLDGTAYELIMLSDQDHWGEIVPHYETFVRTLRSPD